MKSISFESSESELILCYAPAMEIDDIAKRLSTEDGFQIKNTFYVTKELLRKIADSEDDWEETLRFCIGQVGEKYTLLNSDVIGTEHSFYFGNEIKLKPEMFVAYRNISILRKIDSLIQRDFYVGGDWETHNGISKETYDNLLKKFPKTAELDKYANNRIASILKDYFPECDKYEKIYDRFIESKTINVTSRPSLSKYNLQIELEQFSVAYKELKEMLSRYEAIDEKQWQLKIHNILQLLYPKYILCAQEIKFQGIDKYDKRPDFMLVDANGFVDVLEIKKADILILTKYRNNYVASRELSGAIQQIEKYIFCLNSSDKAKEDVSNKLSPRLPASVKVNIVNPQGILILGRSNEFSIQQQQDFELIKRQYKHVADIMTYDDLAQRLSNIIASLQKRI